MLDNFWLSARCFPPTYDDVWTLTCPHATDMQPGLQMQAHVSERRGFTSQPDRVTISLNWTQKKETR